MCKKYFLRTQDCLLALLSLAIFSSCEKNLDEKTYDKWSETTFFKTAADAKLAVSKMYTGMTGNPYFAGGWGSANEGWVAQSSMSTDELICSWGWDGWPKLNTLNFSEDFSQLLNHYNALMPKISEIAIDIDKIQQIDMDETLKNRYIAELKALRAHYSWVLYNFYGPVPIRIDAKEASDPNATPLPRPTAEWMVSQIIKDYTEAAAVLPLGKDLAAADYGRFTKNACVMGLLKLYMHEKRWQDAITTGQQLQTLGNSLQANYADIFSYANKGNSQEVILAIPCRSDANTSANYWLAMCLPGNYVDPSGQEPEQWGGYKMPWATYDKFDPADKRLTRLMSKWPTGSGALYDGRANGSIGAIPMKYGVDPTYASSGNGVDIVVWRYADALLLLAEAMNELSGPTQVAYDLVNSVRARAGLSGLTAGLTKDQFRSKLMDERLFELWCEGSRREDMIRWGTYIQHAMDNGSTFAKPEFVLYPLPRKVIDETNGVITQNSGY